MNQRGIEERDLRTNGYGYPDPTAYRAIKNIDNEEERFHKLLYMIFDICELSDFKLEGRITLTDQVTGRTWR